MGLRPLRPGGTSPAAGLSPGMRRPYRAPHARHIPGVSRPACPATPRASTILRPGSGRTVMPDALRQVPPASPPPAAAPVRCRPRDARPGALPLARTGLYL